MTNHPRNTLADPPLVRSRFTHPLVLPSSTRHPPEAPSSSGLCSRALHTSRNSRSCASHLLPQTIAGCGTVSRQLASTQAVVGHARNSNAVLSCYIVSPQQRSLCLFRASKLRETRRPQPRRSRPAAPLLSHTLATVLAMHQALSN
jgi:hypothetical protein